MEPRLAVPYLVIVTAQLRNVKSATLDTPEALGATASAKHSVSNSQSSGEGLNNS